MVRAQNCEVMADKSDAGKISTSVTNFFLAKRKKEQEIKKSVVLQISSMLE
jgi:hypothetical protein